MNVKVKLGFFFYRMPWEWLIRISLKRWLLSSDLKEFINKSQAQRGGKGVLSKRNSVRMGSRERGSRVCTGDWKKVSLARAHRGRRLGWKRQGLHQLEFRFGLCLIKVNGKPLRCLSSSKVGALFLQTPCVVLVQSCSFLSSLRGFC